MDKALGDQLDAATGKMNVAQNEIVSTATGSLKQRATNALQEFERSMEGLAQASIERWRVRVAGGLNAVAKSLGEQLQAGETER